MLETKLEEDAVHIGKHFSVIFQRTLRIYMRKPTPTSPNGKRMVIYVMR
jgi:hypothetical protein